MDLTANKIDGVSLPITNTRISASEWNQLVASCMAFIEAAGMTPDGTDNEQLLNACKRIVQNMGLGNNSGGNSGGGSSTGSLSITDIVTMLVPDTSSRTEIQRDEVFTAPFAGWCIFQCDGSNDTDLYIAVNNVRVGGFSVLVKAGDEVQRWGVGSWPLYFWPCKGESNAL